MSWEVLNFCHFLLRFHITWFSSLLPWAEHAHRHPWAECKTPSGAAMNITNQNSPNMMESQDHVTSGKREDATCLSHILDAKRWNGTHNFFLWFCQCTLIHFLYKQLFNKYQICEQFINNKTSFFFFFLSKIPICHRKESHLLSHCM